MITVEGQPFMKYQYAIYTWGGFYNQEYQSQHKYEPGQRVFDTKEERDDYIADLRVKEISLDARHLMMVLDEGFAVNEVLTCHRVIKFEGKYYYSSDVISVWGTFEEGVFGTASYHMRWKWYPGFNDYPAGEGKDYSKAEVIQEWITGAFKPDES